MAAHDEDHDGEGRRNRYGGSVPATPRALSGSGVWHYRESALWGRSGGALAAIMNVIWLVFAGVWLALLYAFVGAILYLLVVTIPFGRQCFKLAGFALWPFGRAIVSRGDHVRDSARLLGNAIWVIVAGLWLSIAHLITGVILCVSVIGLPLGLADLKMIPLVFAPFGKEVVGRDEVCVGDVRTTRAVAF